MNQYLTRLNDHQKLRQTISDQHRFSLQVVAKVLNLRDAPFQRQRWSAQN